MSDPARSLVRMPETPLAPPIAPAAAANEAIRVFMTARAGRPLFEAERVEYGRLLAAWAKAQQGEVAEAA